MPDNYTEPSVFVSKAEYTALIEHSNELEIIHKVFHNAKYSTEVISICKAIFGDVENDNF